MNISINQSPKRVFVVGCPRSGTTLLQSILLTNPTIISFPESHFFTNLFRQREKFQVKFNLASRQSRPGFQKFIQESGYQNVRQTLPRYALSVRQHTQAFTRTLDAIATQQQKTIWIEKTPDHVNFIDFIETHISDSQFIHIVRNGPDVVASLYDVTHKYPDDWEGPWTIDRCLKKWMTCVKNTHRHLHKPNHLLVNYEQLVRNPDAASQQVGQFLGADLELAALNQRKQSFNTIALKREPWKANSAKPIAQSRPDKFHSLFDQQQQSYILETLATAGLINTERYAHA